MNVEHVRTFLAVAETGSFVAAADRLHVTQSTVSARIRTLEQNLGSPLFVRNRAGASLTRAGKRFIRPAGVMVRAYEHARQDIGLPDRIGARVSIGARIGLWDGLLSDWFCELNRRHADTYFRAEIGFEPDIMQGLIEGRLDIGCLYTPQQRPGLDLIALFTEQLVLVSSSATTAGLEDNYIHVDWGPEFQDQFGAAFPGAARPSINVNIGWLGLQILRSRGGCGYFPMRLVREALDSSALRLVAGTPVFDLPAWVLMRRDRDRKLIDPMIERLAAACAAP